MANNYGTITSVTQKTTYSNTTTALQKVEEIQCLWDDRDDYTPDISSTSGSYKLVSAVQESLPAGLCKITLTWEIPVGSDGGTGIPATTFDEDTTYVELDIKQHPDFASWSDEWDSEKGEFKPESDKYGITSYVVGSTTVRKTEYFSSTPSSRYASVGTLESPGGGYAGSNKWLLIGCSRRKVAESLYARETLYLYSAKAYNSDIYS